MILAGGEEFRDRTWVALFMRNISLLKIGQFKAMVFKMLYKICLSKNIFSIVLIVKVNLFINKGCFLSIDLYF